MIEIFFYFAKNFQDSTTATVLAIKLPAGRPSEGYFGSAERPTTRIEAMETDEPAEKRTKTNSKHQVGRQVRFMDPAVTVGRQMDPLLPGGDQADQVLHVGRSAKKFSRNFEESKKSAENSAEDRLLNKELRQAFKKKRKDRKRLQKKTDRLSDVLATAMDFDKGGGENYDFQEHFR